MGGKPSFAKQGEETRPFFIGGRVGGFETGVSFFEELSRRGGRVEGVAVEREGKVSAIGEEGVVGIF